MLKLGDLALRPDVQLGPMLVSPSRRLVEGPGGHTNLEPLIMQVFLMLLDAGGQVVTRNDLFEQCWGGVYVGDDSLNRAIAKVRRTGAQVAPGLFEIETIPRTGYRLTGRIVGLMDSSKRPVSGLPLSRRALVGGGAAAVAIAAGGGLWWAMRPDSDEQQVMELIEEGHQILRESVPRQEMTAVRMLSRAVALDPDNAEAWGLLALAYRERVENGAPEVVTAAVRDTDRTANRALELDPDNGNALTARIMLRPEFGNWQTVEGQLRQALARDPDCTAAMNFLTLLLQSVGRATESFRVNELSARLDPLDVTPQYRLAIKHWIFGRVDEADLVLNRGLQIWPYNPTLWNTRLMVLAYSGRAPEALRYLEQSLKANPAFARTGALWRITLEALSTDDPKVRSRAREAIRDRAVRSSGASVHAIMFLSRLGLLDDAFEVANGYYRWRGRLAGAEKAEPSETLLNDQAWRRTMALFTPATRAMRLDSRFDELTEAIGMADYWRRTGTRPDRFLFR